MHLRDLVAERQSEARAVLLPGPCLIDHIESLGYALDLVGGNAAALVLNGESIVIADVDARYPDRLRSGFESVVDKVH